MHTHTHSHTLSLSRSEEHTSELQSHLNLVCRLLLEKKKHIHTQYLSDTHTQHSSTAHTHTLTHTRTDNVIMSHTQHQRHEHTRTHTLIFFFNDTATTEIYTLPLNDALPI